MEYTQLTLNDWLELKHKLKMELQGVRQSFVRIGFALRKIDDQKLYEQDGYKSVAEFAKAEYGLEASTVSRFMSINREYSIDGYSEHLREEFLDMSRSQLEEMLMLPDRDREMIKPEASREDIRELKRFNKEDPMEGQADDIHVLIEKFFKENEEILNELYSCEAFNTGETDKLIEIVNPSGNKGFRKGLYFLMMYEDNIKIKRHGEDPQNMSWSEFFVITREIFDKSAAGAGTYKNHFGSSEQAVDGQTEIQEQPETVQKEKQEESVQKEEIAPAQKSEKPLKTLNEEGVLQTSKTKKTEEEEYNEQQSKLDRESKKKLQEMEDEKKMEVLPSEMPKTIHQIRCGKTFFEEILKGIKQFTLRKDDRNYKVGDILEKQEFDDGKYTGRSIRQEIIYKQEDYTGLVDGYCILGTKNIKEEQEC